MGRAKVIAAGALLGLSWAVWRNATPADEAAQTDPTADLGAIADNLTDELENLAMGTTYGTGNIDAFLKMIRFAEGTSGPNGYRTMFGGGLFNDYADHPRKAHQFTDGDGRRLWTTAAGAYQFMAVSPIPTGGRTKVDTWDRLKRKLGLLDFGPESQDRAALELIDECGALADVRAGRFAVAVGKVRKVWASMPGAGYSQPEKSINKLAAVYAEAGGAFA